MNDKGKLIAVTKISTKGTSIRMSLPKEVAEILDMSESEHVGFYQVDGLIVIRRIE